ncbi:hypothetical protein BHM03_00027982 [Ensete ventricosum]|nr:hypothetical protein BHM03_00027982 [Ensete ventricosum]
MVSEPREGNKEEGRPATTSPHAGSATHDQAVAKAPCQGVAGCGQGQPEREASGARKGRRLWAQAPPAGEVACSAALAKGAICRAPSRGCRPWPTLPLVRAVAPTAGVAAP